MVTSSSREVERIYRMNPTLCRELRTEPRGDGYMLKIIQFVWGVECFSEFEGIYHSTVCFDRLPCKTSPFLLMVLEPGIPTPTLDARPRSTGQNLHQSSGHSRKPGTYPRNKF